MSSTNWECNKNANGKPPTPPLHRFPSWESRIYRVANEGLSNSAPPYSELSSHLPQSVSFTGSGYYDVSCPVYATVKGVSECRIFCTNPQILFFNHHSSFVLYLQRASQIRASPFSGDSSDDSSDGEDHLHSHLVANLSHITNSSTDNTGMNHSSQLNIDPLHNF